MNIAKLKKFIVSELGSQLSDDLSYHNVQHTLAVLDNCNKYIRRLKITPYDAYLLRTAALLHDTGFMFGYEEHEERSIKFAKNILPKWNYTAQEIDRISAIIRATKIPQRPLNELENIIADSDLDYLGTDKFYPVGERLFEELKALGKLNTRTEWNSLQIKFLQNHSYHTLFAQKYREPLKQKHLHELMQMNSD
ncbi:HD domain-containing protein [Maribellus mangrovi]|uniref:HD domain-containing protein n=1 Tax=Maribellus mangrovi TaxID=3133146 RepID=UPI0030EB4311